MCDHPSETLKFSNLAKALELNWVKNPLTLSYTERTTGKFRLLIRHFFAISWFYLSIPGYKVLFSHSFLFFFIYLFISIFIFSLPNLCKIVGKFSRRDRFVVLFFPFLLPPFSVPLLSFHCCCCFLFLLFLPLASSSRPFSPSFVVRLGCCS